MKIGKFACSKVLGAVSLLLCIVIGVGVYFSVDTYLINEARKDVTAVLLDHKGLHRYVQETMIPRYIKAQEEGDIAEDFYAPEILSSSYIIRNQHRYYNEERKKLGLPEIYYKLAAKNPRNPINAADEHEKMLLEQFSRSPDLRIQEGVDVENGASYLHVSIPFLVNEDRCMRCHSDRESAPTGLQDLYPGEGGFNEKVGDLRAMTSIKVKIHDDHKPAIIVSVIIGFISMLFTLLIIFNLRLKKAIDIKANELDAESKEKAVLQSRLNQAQKMEAIGTLAGGIAHDFNNILSAVLGYTELSVSNIGDPKQKDYLDKVLTATERARCLVQQILCFSRQSEAQKVPIQIASSIKGILKLMKVSIPDNIRVVDHIEDLQELSVVDPTQLHQVITNLCTNACHSMEKTGGCLTVTLKSIILNDCDISTKHPDATPGKYLHLSVSDTGHGISPEALPRIFEPYFTTKGPGRGTGMGLAIVHGIIKNYGGFTSVYSEVNKGTTMNVFFPTYEGKECGTTVIGTDKLEKGTGTILFVDDDPMLVEMGKATISMLGYNVVGVDSSTKALEVFQCDPYKFDLVITDQLMPEMTGLDLSKHLLDIRPDIKIIMCSGYSSIMTEEEVLKIGIKRFTMKPITIYDISKVIKEVLKK